MWTPRTLWRYRDRVANDDCRTLMRPPESGRVRPKDLAEVEAQLGVAKGACSSVLKPAATVAIRVTVQSFQLSLVQVDRPSDKPGLDPAK